MLSFVRNHAPFLTALLLILGCYFLTRLPHLPRQERERMAQRFQFETEPLSGENVGVSQRVRAVNPRLEHISGWISSVGAAIALTDLDHDGFANDYCLVDPRHDHVLVAPVPGTGQRFESFSLDASPLPFDRRTMAPMGCVPGDFNEDGLADVLVYYWGRPPLIFLNQQHSVAAPHAEAFLRQEIAPSSQRWFTNALTTADVDGDGHLDLIVGNYFPDGARVLDAQADSPEQMQDSMSRAFNGGHNRILLWTDANVPGSDPSVTYREAENVLTEDVARAWTLAVGAADLDGDQLPEIYFANDFGPDRLLHNRSQPGHPRFHPLEGRKGLTTPNSKVLGRDSFKGMGVDFGDVNGDGMLDIYVSNIADEYALEESHFVYISTGKTEWMARGVAPYEDLSEPLGLSRSGWGWDARLADFDNDGVLEALQATGFVRGIRDRWPELHELAMGNDALLRLPTSWPRFQPGDDLSGAQHNPFFVRAAGGRYYDLAPELGLDQKQVTRGIALADVDGDGDMDFAVANQWEASRFYRNHAPKPGDFLGLRLLLPVGSAPPKTISQPGLGPHPVPARPAVGATAAVLLGSGRQLVAQVDGGSGHAGVRAPDLLFGLGHLKSDDSLTVRLQWRDGAGQIRLASLQLRPGWHTVLLGQDPAVETVERAAAAASME